MSAIRLSVRQWAKEDRPSVKLQSMGAGALTDTELISLLVGSGTPQYNAVEIADAILAKFDRDLTKLSKAGFHELKEIDGVGASTICKIMAAIELGKRRQLATMGLRPDISSAESIFNYMRPILQDLTIEEAHVMLLSQNYKLIKEMRVSQGGLTEVSVDVRMIIKEAVLNNATVLAFVHNHPSGNIHPSKFDDTLTQTLKKACDLMRIHFLDHVIVCDGDYYSYHERGRL
ncbi:MAG: DNA repair protein RadC [Prevotella sp.]|nr:DNA repair protein RadC [Prevotella sp.]